MSREISIEEFAARSELRKSKIRKTGSLSLFLGPYGICFLIFFCVPLIFGAVMSFCKFDGKSFMPSGFVGWDNYEKLFTNPTLSRDFWGSVWITFRFALIIVPLSIVIPLFLAMLINIKPWGYKIFRACIYLPSIFPLTATGMILLKMFAKQDGFINALFNINLDWFGDTTLAWFMVGLFCLWCGIGGNFIILDAGLENIDKTLCEAAQIDGSNKWQSFLHVTLPGIKNQIYLCFFTTFISFMNLYGQVYILCSNTPDQDAMKTAVYRIQDLLLGSSKSYGYAAAMGIFLGIIIAFISIIEMAFTNERKGGHRHEKAFLGQEKSC